MHQHTLVHGHDIIKAAAFMHSQSHGTVLKLISEGKFHFVAVRLCQRTTFDPLKIVAGRKNRI